MKAKEDGIVELLVLKCGGDYFRQKDGEFIRCSLDKASVYRPAQAQEARKHVAVLKAQGFANACIRLLRLTEEPYPGDVV